jgi:hypothetical protein
MNATKIMAAAAAAFALCAWADDADQDAAGQDVSGEGQPAAVRADAKIFNILPLCRALEGTAEVMLPGTGTWQPAQEGRYYPLGSSYRSVGPDSRVSIMFGPESEVILKGDGFFSTRAQAVGDQTRAITLGAGVICVKLPNNLPEGRFKVCAPGFTALNPAGESRFAFKGVGDGDEAVIRCVTQSLSVEGRHFRIPQMRSANEIKIRTSQDNLMTAIYGKSGDVPVVLDQGRIRIKDFETGEMKEEDKTLEWKLSPQTAVRIHRALPSIGERMSVSVMTFDANGELCNRCAFAEGRVEVNTGELGPTSRKEREDLAKRAASATEAEGAEGDDAGSTTEEQE